MAEVKYNSDGTVTVNGKTMSESTYLKNLQKFGESDKSYQKRKNNVVKIDSNPVKPGSTTVSPLAKKRGPSKLASFGGGMGGMFSPKNR